MILQTSPSTNRRSPKAFLAPPLLAFLNQQGSRQAGLCTTSRFVLRSYLWHKWYPINEYEFVEEKGIVEKCSLFIIIYHNNIMYIYIYVQLYTFIQNYSNIIRLPCQVHHKLHKYLPHSSFLDGARLPEDQPQQLLPSRISQQISGSHVTLALGAAASSMLYLYLSASPRIHRSDRKIHQSTPVGTVWRSRSD